jgi:hypothetical protein
MANDASTAIPPAPSAPNSSFASRFGGVFFSPAEAFRAIARAPDVLPPLVVLIAVSVVTWEVILRQIGAAQVVRSQLEASGRASSMTPEQLQAAVSQGAKYAPMVGRVFAFLGVPIFLLIIALLGLAIMKAFFGQQFSFTTAYSVAAYAELPTIIGYLLVIVVVLFGDPATFNMSNPAPTDLGFFLSPQTVAKPLYTAATSVNIFSFWFMALLGVGFSEAVGRKVRARTVFLCFFSVWVLWVLLKMGMAAM